MKNLIPDFSSKAERFAYLRTNKSKILAQKKALPTTSDDLEFGYSIIGSTKTFGNKASGDPVAVDGELPVDIIANMSGWCDSQMDVMIKDSWKKSISDISASGQKIIYHLQDHDYCMDAIIGKDPSLYAKDLDLSMFNIITDVKKAQALIMQSIVCKLYGEKVYQLYVDGQVKQHSIGLQYLQIVLCLDSTEEEDVAEKKNWDKYYPQVINKEKVDNYGYFWAVIEAKILEVSAVLFGANILTPVLSSGQPSKFDTGDQPPKGTGTTESEQESKSIVACPNCSKLFVANTGLDINCPDCGQYVSPQSNTITMSEEVFDWKKAIAETTFVIF